MPTLKDRFQGCLIGLAIGDAVGAKFEAQSGDFIHKRFSTSAALLEYPTEEIWYTDDTQMTIGVAETLLAEGEIREAKLCAAFVANYVPSRGYAWGARDVLNAMEEGRDYGAVAEKRYPGGSYGNGAAMRVAPVGLFFRDDFERLWTQARASAWPTHRHPLGIEGAQLLALAIGLVSGWDSFDRERFFAALLEKVESEVYRDKLTLASSTQSLTGLGNGIQALESVPTALASFALAPDSFADTIANVIFLGGDTDTLAAMAGALSGAYLGLSQLPQRLVQLLETSPKGRDYLVQLGARLFEKYENLVKTAP